MARKKKNTGQGNLMNVSQRLLKFGTIERGATASGTAGIRPRVFNYPLRNTGKAGATSGRDKVSRTISMGSSGG